MPGSQSIANPAIITGATAPFGDVSMEREPRIQMSNVIVVPKAMLGSPPACLRLDMAHRADNGPRFELNGNCHLIEQEAPVDRHHMA